MDDRSPTEYEELVISKIKEGGFLVRHPGYAGRMAVELFASSDIGDALNFIRGKLIGNPPSEVNTPVKMPTMNQGIGSLGAAFKR